MKSKESQNESTKESKDNLKSAEEMKSKLVKDFLNNLNSAGKKKNKNSK
jgi:hypothetical protein